MNLQEYERDGRALYTDFCEVVADLLTRALDGEQGYRLQQIQFRAKGADSLKERLQQHDALGSDDIESLRKDLAGCRVVFYTNDDVNRFATSGILRELFEIDWDRSKFHQPGLNNQEAAKLFQSYNYVVRLKDDRTELVEYSRFKGLWCEIQVQTSLNHAWSEMAHDIIYKRPEIKGFGEREFAMIERRLGEVMREHLLPAGYMFQKIASDVQRLMDGKELFDLGAVDALLNAADNNERKEAVERLRDDVLPYYDDPQTEFPELSEKLKQAWLLAEKTEAKPNETPFGNHPGAETHDVAKVITDIFERYRYIDPNATYAIIRELFAQTTNEDSRKHLVDLAKKLAAHTLQIWEKYGPVVQSRLAAALKAEESLQSMTPIAAAICGEILKPDITGTTSSSNAVTFHTGAVVYSEPLATARRDAIDVLIQMATAAPSENDQRLAISNLFLAGSPPQHHGYSNKIMAMILEDSSHMVRALHSILAERSMTLRQDVESHLLHLWRHYKLLRDDLLSDEAVVDARSKLLEGITALRDELNEDREFIIFKTLVGFRSVFPHMWEDDGLDFERDQRIRKESQDELLDEVSDTTWGAWKARLVNAAALKSDDGATFSPLVHFLQFLAARHPALGMELLNDRVALPRWTLHPIAGVLLNTDAADDTKAALRAWVEDGEYLPEIAAIVGFAKNVDRDLLLRVAEVSREVNDEAACITLIEAATRKFSENKALWRDEIFFPCLNRLKAAGNHRWVDHTWYSAKGDSLFAHLDEAQRAALLGAMSGLPTIDYRAEAILEVVAQQDHMPVLEFFGKRIAKAEEEGRHLFDAIPFSFYEVNKTFQRHPRDVLNALRQWSDAGGASARWHLSHFLSRVYPEFQSPLPEALSEMIAGADSGTLSFIATVLEGFEGRKALLPLLRDILSSEAATDEIERAVSYALHETGVMTGEFGPAQTYQAKADALKPWLNDESDRVANFAKKEIRGLERIVASETRRAQEEIALRRLEYGEPLGDGNATMAGTDRTKNGDNSGDRAPWVHRS